MKRTFRLEGLGCANCAAKMEREISKLDGVKYATVNFLTTKMVIEADDDKMDGIIEEAGKVISRIESGVTVKRA
ncbi:MAG TPA: heavy-metal-associated domain-containing protein [Thermoclostridium sp.]